MLLYSLLHLTGYDVTLDDLKSFRQWGSRTPGHPEYGLTPGVEATTGPLGQGFTNAVGMAIAERRLAAEFNRPGHDVVDHRTYVIARDGDLQEGIASEAASPRRPPAAAASSSSCTTTTTSSSTGRRRWPGPRTCSPASRPTAGRRSASRTATTSRRSRPPSDGAARRPAVDHRRPHAHRLRQPEQARHPEGPRLAARPGRGPPDQGGLRLGSGRALLRPGRGARLSSVQPSPRARRWSPTGKRGCRAYAEAYPGRAAELRRRLAGRPGATAGTRASRPTRPVRGSPRGNASQDAIQALAGPRPGAVRRRRGPVRIEPDRRQGRRRLRASDGRAQPPLRCPRARDGRHRQRDRLPRRVHPVRRDVPDLQRLHARIGAAGRARRAATSSTSGPTTRSASGEDGPTHQPVEHYAALRAIPNLWFVRPGDANEAPRPGRWPWSARDGPVALALTRQKLPTLPGTDGAGARGRARAAATSCGAASSEAAGGSRTLILIATGSELQLAIAAAEALEADGIADARRLAPLLGAVRGAGRRRTGTAVLPPARHARESPSRWASRSAGSAGSATRARSSGSTTSGRQRRRGTIFEHFGFTD